MRVVAHRARDERALALPCELLGRGEPALEPMSLAARELENDHGFNNVTTAPNVDTQGPDRWPRSPDYPSRSCDRRLHPLDAPHLVAHRDDASRDDRRERQDRTDRQRRDAG